MLGKRSRPIRRTTSMTLLGPGRSGSIPPMPEHPEGRHNPPVVATFGAQGVVLAHGHQIVSLTQPPEIIQGQQFGLPNGVGNVHPDGANRCMSPGTVGMLPNGSNTMSVEAVSVPKQQDVCMQFETENVNRDSIPSPLISPPSARLPDLSPQSPHDRHQSSNGHSFANQPQSPKENFPQSTFHNLQARPPAGSQNTEWDQYAGTLYSSPVSCAERRIEGAAPIPPVNFLDACFLCKRRLGNGRDIYMYRGDRAFCSVECRHHQIVLDERREKCSLTAATKANTAPAHHSTHNGKAVPTGTAAAA